MEVEIIGMNNKSHLSGIMEAEAEWSDEEVDYHSYEQVLDNIQI